MTNEHLTMSIPEFAKLTGISRGLAYRLARQDQLPCKVIHLGSRLVLARKSVDTLLNGETPPTSAEKG